MAWRAALALCLCACASAPAAAPPGPAAAPGPAAPATPACAASALCTCHGDHLACTHLPFHIFPDTGGEVRHVSVWGARLAALGEAALDGRRLRTLVLGASHTHHIHPHAFTSMASTLASLDLGFNEFTEVPLEALRELKVLNWLNLQNNVISNIDPHTDWGSLSESLSSLSLSNNHLYTLEDGAFAGLRALSQLELDGNRVHAVSGGALPGGLVVLRLAGNLLVGAPCAALARLPRLRHLHLRNNMLAPQPNHSLCQTLQSRIDTLDLGQNDLTDNFQTSFFHSLKLKQINLDFNDFTSIPHFVKEHGRLEKLSISHNKLSHISEYIVEGLKLTLEELVLDYNRLSSLPANIRDLVCLRHLSLGYNLLENVTDLPPNLYSLNLAGNFLSAFPEGLFSLEPGILGYLDLSYNQLSAVGGGEWGAWSGALATLNLRGNRLATVSADSFPAALPLRELLLSFNDLYYVDPFAFLNLTKLQVLELSSTMFSGEFPMKSTFEKLSWLSLDNNNIHFISSSNILSFPSLEFLNLDFNKIMSFPSEYLAINKSYVKIKELRLSYNYITTINSEFLEDLVDLQSLDLSYNHLHNVSERSFSNLLNVVYLSLAGNAVEFLTDGAFHNLPKLQVLDLQENNLLEFSTESFESVSSEETNFSVNASHNKISSLLGGASVFINIIDLSYNVIENISRSFCESLGPHVRQIILSFNRLLYIDHFDLSALPFLEILSIHDNFISIAKRRAFAEIPALQLLDLSNNNMTQLSVEQFHNSRRLRQLRLRRNLLRSLPRDVFRYTVLEHLDLSDNQLALFPSSALAQVGFTLRRLELAGNRIEYLDAAMFHATAFLRELTLARNALTVLSDNTFLGLSRLSHLDISYNALKANYKELFHNLPRLRRLSLAGVGLETVPHLPLSNLTELDLSANDITFYRGFDVRHLKRLKILNLAQNRLKSIEPAMWNTFSWLSVLDISHNPLVRISEESFRGLERLLSLRLQRLRHLEALQPRAFRPLRSLRSLHIDLPLLSETSDTSVANILVSAPFIESLTIHMWESLLDRQLRDLRAPKLRNLEIRGTALKHISGQAFSGVSGQRALALRVSGTSVAALPAGLVLRVPLLALDLSDNRLAAFTPATLYPNLTGWNRFATKLLPGGLVLSGNPLRCGCAVWWVGAWLRRWTAEVGGGAAGARAAARGARCGAGGAGGAGGGGRALLALHADEAGCHASALSSRSPRHAHTLSAFLWIVFLHSIS